MSGRGSVSQIAGELNADGVPYSQPGPWDYGRVKRVLQNELTTGVLAYSKTSHALGGPRVRLKSAQWGRLRLFEAMVPNATFKAAQLGLEASHGVRHTSASMVEALRSLLRQHGFLSRRLVDATPGVPRAVTYVARFGSLREAFLLAGYSRTQRRREHIDPAGMCAPEVLKRMQALLEAKAYLSERLVDTSPDLPHSDTVRCLFGSLKTAYRLAGFDVSRSEMLSGVAKTTYGNCPGERGSADSKRILTGAPTRSRQRPD